MSNLKNFLFTSESVSEGHPDKVCHDARVLERSPWLAVDHVVDFLVGAPLVAAFGGGVLHELRGVLVALTGVKVHVEGVVVGRADGGADA